GRATTMGILNGLAAGGALIVLAFCASVPFLPFPTHDSAISDVRSGSYLTYALPAASDYMITALVSFGALFASIVSAIKLRNSWETDGARMKQLSYSCIGLLLSFLALGATEAKSVVLRLAEQCAVNGTVSDKPQALEIIRRLDGERELKLEIGEPRSTGMA